MNPQIISFKPDGTARCLWTEAVPLHKIGQLKITRASSIEFNPQGQEWEVRDLQDNRLYSNVSRTACLEWEQDNLQPE